MAEFYRALLVDGASVSAALRKAQIQLFKSRPTSAPFYWRHSRFKASRRA
jgi:CHAT domain-containing protein